MRDLRRQDEGKPEQQKRQPSYRIELQRANKRYARAPRAVARVAAPERNRHDGADADGTDKRSFIERAATAGHHEGIPCEKTEGQSGRGDRGRRRPTGKEQVAEADDRRLCRLRKTGSGGHAESVFKRKCGASLVAE